MGDIVGVTVQLVSAGIGLDQQAVRQAGLAEHAAVWLALGIRFYVAARHARIDAVYLAHPRE